jgi:hypothetical protein
MNNLFFDQGAEMARKGMCMIRPIELAKDSVIYRFYDSNRARTPENGMRGVWWNLSRRLAQHLQTLG